jgi:hypothetical protein
MRGLMKVLLSVSLPIVCHYFYIPSNLIPVNSAISFFRDLSFTMVAFPDFGALHAKINLTYQNSIIILFLPDNIEYICQALSTGKV